MQTKLSAIQLDHDSYIALHVQLHNALRQLILAGRWQQGERIPSETQLAQHLQISRTTVRIALQRAEVEGLITRAAGRGTFVTYNADTRLDTRFIGFVTRSFHNEIHRTLLSSVEAELRTGGYSVVFSKAGSSQDEVAVLRQMHGDKVKGVILWANARVTPAQRMALEAFTTQNIPIVFIDRLVDGIEGDFVGSDNFGGTYALIEHLVELGHEHIVYLSHSIANLYPIEERYRGYHAAMNAHNRTIYPIWKLNSPNANEFFETDLFQLLDQQRPHFNTQIAKMLESAAPRPTALVCANDAIAIIAMRAVRELGLKVPEDISIVGFDDISLAAYLDTPLTTISQDAHAIGQQAANILLERLDGTSRKPGHHVVPTKLQIRMSTTTPIEVNLP